MLTIHFFASLVQSVAQCDSLICLTSISDSTFFALFFFCFVFFFCLVLFYFIWIMGRLAYKGLRITVAKDLNTPMSIAVV